MVLSEERLITATTRHPTARVRFGRRVVAEERVVTVTVRREEFFLEHLDLPAALEAGHDENISTVRTEPATEVVIVLREEQPMVSMTLVPRERVTVHLDSVVQQGQVSTTLAREQVEVTRDGSPLH